MPSNASQGGGRASYRKPDLDYYDALPPTARAALANAAFEWSSGYYFNRWKKGALKTGKDIAADVARADRITIKKGVKL
jgi:hypothetical protein